MTTFSPVQEDVILEEGLQASMENSLERIAVLFDEFFPLQHVKARPGKNPPVKGQGQRLGFDQSPLAV